MKKILVAFFLLFSSGLFAQQNRLEGNIFDEKGEALSYATAVLLYPTDSTLAYYGITNGDGFFQITNIKKAVISI
jgi:hypothetical protein